MNKKEDVQDVTPWNVSGDLSYEKLIDQFGTMRINTRILNQIKQYTGEVHQMLRRKIVFSHRDFDWLLQHISKTKANNFALYTGRGPSGNTHLGHLAPWLFTKWLQEKFDVELFFQITDDEKFLIDPLAKSYKQTQEYALENAKDVLAIGFDPEKTHLIINSQTGPKFRELATRVASRINYSTAKAVFGFTDATNVGMLFHTAMQSAPCFFPSELRGENIPVLIPAGIDQDPYWRITRDIAEKLGYYKPTALHLEFIPGLTKGGKMSASNPNSAIFTTDNPKTAMKKVNKAVTGGRISVEEQKKLGGKPEECNIFSWYKTIFEDNDNALTKRFEDCKTGFLLCGPCKQELGERVIQFLEKHQTRREDMADLVELTMMRD